MPLGTKNTRIPLQERVRARVMEDFWAIPVNAPLEKTFLVGEVHDCNAWRLDGIGGNAGMFSTAADLAAYSLVMLPTDEAFPKTTVGHTGLTGTSMVIEPQSELCIILLTNRVCGVGTAKDFRMFRRHFHAVVARSIGTQYFRNKIA